VLKLTAQLPSTIMAVSRVVVALALLALLAVAAAHDIQG
jgi:hypothetical protein